MKTESIEAEFTLIDESVQKVPLNKCFDLVADIYDHKHQDLSPDDATTGLSKMSCDIAKFL